MYDKSQLMRGTLEGCILKILSDETTYGYEIVTKLQNYGFQDIREGTIYPLLVRLEKKQIISSEFRPSPLGPSRKYYSITEEGLRYLEEFKKHWVQVVSSINVIFGLEG
ncbi:PadR family transcriptional regulator [Extibacter muris]|uniref:PadR family transcriptional regulator n=1 Tax=Extibacter muris TaxID=1796622 RepID=UPI001D075B7A|nr:PadR family transcriptional regulator [Extibacter muris]MCB6201993.1 PadR family transcriptional regulator [Extibacter muris]MCQ4663334.1 PadR family transcriptional regulator [Extibacter muris]MCQ4692626.1 PadR family transcriptional regulator [Extibacter muris]